tara:strand:+ start:694 stop:972 length:279 start_codon:yes stop_codon:yes gene_type:complete
MNKFLILIRNYVILISIFTLLFSFFDHTHFDGFGELDDSTIPKRIFNRLYFTITTVSSVGYGDISPKTTDIRCVVMILQTILIFAVVDYFNK